MRRREARLLNRSRFRRRITFDVRLEKMKAGFHASILAMMLVGLVPFGCISLLYTAHWLFCLITGQCKIDTILTCLPFILPVFLAAWGVAVIRKIVRVWNISAQCNLVALYFAIYSYASFVAFMDRVQPRATTRDEPLLGTGEWLAVLTLLAVPLLFAMISFLRAPQLRPKTEAEQAGGCDGEKLDS